MLVCTCIFKNSGLDFSSTLCGQLGPKYSEMDEISFANVLKIYGHGPKILVRVLKYLNQCTLLCCTKNPVTHTHTHTLRVQTQLSHSDKPPKQTKTETSQHGSHRQKSPRPEVIRCYSNEKTLHETIQSWLTLVNFKYMLVCICIFKNSCLVFLSTLQ